VILVPAMIAALQLSRPPIAPRVVFDGPVSGPLEGRWAIEVCHLSASSPLTALDPSPPVLLWSIPLR
jgi:hypothetical protein